MIDSEDRRLDGVVALLCACGGLFNVSPNIKTMKRALRGFKRVPRVVWKDTLLYHKRTPGVTIVWVRDEDFLTTISLRVESAGLVEVVAYSVETMASGGFGGGHYVKALAF